jgi:hypothetical protein
LDRIEEIQQAMRLLAKNLKEMVTKETLKDQGIDELSRSEQNLVGKLETMEMVNKGFDSDSFTKNVTATIDVDGSLDFENNKVFKSNRVDALKEKFKNRMPRKSDLG